MNERTLGSLPSAPGPGTLPSLHTEGWEGLWPGAGYGGYWIPWSPPLCSVTSPFLAHAQPPSNQSSENALGIKSTVGCVVSDKSLALSELQLPSQPGGFIILTFRTIQEVQFDQSSNIQQAPPECLAPYQACRSPGLAWKSRACPGSSAQGWT